MNRISGITLGLALIFIGGLKTWMHLQAARTLTLPGCLGPDFIIRLDGPVALQAHCWGCYVAMAGLALVSATIMRTLWMRQIDQSMTLSLPAN